jgi:aryl-alcohol dehydrogenase-like predicted oxidoreductase
MEYRKLGHTEIDVSVICLGTMNFGAQNTEAEAHAQLDYALAQGINFLDTAEMYPVPPGADVQGSTETFIGSWLGKRKDRHKLIVATKVTGPTSEMTWIRGGPRLNRTHMEQALADSLRRLQTDYIDLYQVHWPERHCNMFGHLGYTVNDAEDADAVPIEETLAVLHEFVKSGKVRYIGVSNETPWGVMRYLKLTEKLGYPRIVSIQNPYSLLNRTYEIGLAEISHRERCGLLAYSPLGFGVLSGKYLGGAQPANARLTLSKRFKRYLGPIAEKATQAYVTLAKQHGLSPAQMALAYCNSRPFLTSTIIGASQMQQLAEDISSVDIKLSREVLEGIEKIHTEIPNPCP